VTIRNGLARILVFLLLLPLPVSAVSIGRASPHDPAQVRCSFQHFVDFVNRRWDYLHGRIEDEVIPSGISPALYVDGRLLVLDQRVEYLRSFDGVEDQGPLVVSAVVPLIEDEFQPVYLVQFTRTRWAVDEDLYTGEVTEGFSPEISTWIAGFYSNGVLRLIEAFELAPLVAGRTDIVPPCMPSAIREVEESFAAD
jgi:hypothetical protein